ncbi:hypothetical protein IQ22_02010 [Pseudomonas duriflava]|uniref:DUF4440 domain-containing protein n=1 Tax=Pseudomonas duriflava TaxID=459528 RepID=A0A562QBN3_9PSED|nr:hypothetical protein [Pseudomonas duriflava]TWI54148.1 hypothetical protein IQ22_02010 [Pseudomonas duriflava]
MRFNIFPLLFLLSFLFLSGCQDDPQAALDKAVEQLQANLEAKKTSAVFDQLHPQFLAQQMNDRQWARQTMTGLFLRYRQIKILAFSKNSQLDPTYTNKGYTDADVGLAGAEGLIPDAARHYRVRMEWWREGGDWKLARLDWQ